MIKNKYRGQTLAWIESIKLTTIILRAPEEYFQANLPRADQTRERESQPSRSSDLPCMSTIGQEESQKVRDRNAMVDEQRFKQYCVLSHSILLQLIQSNISNWFQSPCKIIAWKCVDDIAL